MIIHPDWAAIEAVIDKTDYASAFVGCILYYDENAITSYCLASGTIVLHKSSVDATIDELVAITIHEICHIRLWHHARARQLGVTTQREKEIFNIAADLVVDSIIISDMSVPTNVRKRIDDHLEELRQILKFNGSAMVAGRNNFSLVETVYEALLIEANDSNTTVGSMRYDQNSVEPNTTDPSYQELQAPIMTNPASSMSRHEIAKAKVLKAKFFRKQAWDVLHNHFKVSFGHKYWTEGLLSQRHMLNRTIGGLRMQSRKRKVDASTDASKRHAHSDVVIFMDVSGSIQREWVDMLVDGIHTLAVRARLKGATVITYHSRIQDVVSLANGQSIANASLRIGGGTNINKSLMQAIETYPDLLQNTKQIVVLTDGEDDPITEEVFNKLSAPLLSVVFDELGDHNTYFYRASKGEKLYLPELLAY